MNSAQFHVRFDNCSDVVVDSVTIKAPASSPNTDGIHIENTHNVQIRNSVISNGNFSPFSRFLNSKSSLIPILYIRL